MIINGSKMKYFYNHVYIIFIIIDNIAISILYNNNEKINIFKDKLNIYSIMLFNLIKNIDDDEIKKDILKIIHNIFNIYKPFFYTLMILYKNNMIKQHKIYNKYIGNIENIKNFSKYFDKLINTINKLDKYTYNVKNIKLENKGGSKIDNIIFPKIDIILNDNIKRLKYFDKIDTSTPPIIHQGQRKLLLGEIDFLTRYGHLAKTVLYVGSAPGIHIPLLIILFPTHNFILYDPRKFYYKLKKISSIIIYNKYFTNEDAVKYINYHEQILFISDIRRGNDDEELFEKNVQEDMNLQRKWVEQIKPIMSSLKFRLSFKSGKTEYLDGEIHFQAFAPILSAETRLYTDGKKIKIYDNTKYEEQMFYFNNQIRIGCYDNRIYYKGIDNCFDCALQLYIIKNYLEINNIPINYKNMIKFCIKIDKSIGKSLLTYKENKFYHGKKMNKHECDKFKKEHLNKIISKI